MGSYHIIQKGLDALCFVLALELEHDTKREPEHTRDPPFYMWCDITSQTTMGYTHTHTHTIKSSLHSTFKESLQKPWSANIQRCVWCAHWKSFVSWSQRSNNLKESVRVCVCVFRCEPKIQKRGLLHFNDCIRALKKFHTHYKRWPAYIFTTAFC